MIDSTILKKFVEGSRTLYDACDGFYDPIYDVEEDTNISSYGDTIPIIIVVKEEDSWSKRVVHSSIKLSDYIIFARDYKINYIVENID